MILSDHHKDINNLPNAFKLIGFNKIYFLFYVHKPSFLGMNEKGYHPEQIKKNIFSIEMITIITISIFFFLLSVGLIIGEI